MVSRLFLALILCLTFAGCQYHVRKFAAEYPAAGTVAQWPPAAYDEVRAYCYDYRADSSRSFLHDGRMHNGVMDPKGIKLTSAQIARLTKAVTTSHPKSRRTPCYAPHHAFVYFYKGKSVAVFEMCFGCNQFEGHPGEGLPAYIDTTALWQLCMDLNLPLGVGNDFYTKIVKDFRAANP